MIEKDFTDMIAKEVAKELDFQLYQSITDTPRKQKLRKLLGKKLPTYQEYLEENNGKDSIR